MAFITPQNIFKRWEAAKQYTDQLTDPFPEFQRIANNLPYSGADPAYPDVTDGTTASIIQKTPKRVVQQLPTGTVECDDDQDWLCVVADFIYRNKILPYANEDYGLFEKSQLMIENGLTFGFGLSYAPFLNHDGYFCPDMTVPYWGDIYIQKGKTSITSCDYLFIRSWWQPEDIDALIDSETELAAEAKKRGEKYESTWDTEALKDVKDKLTAKDKQATTPSENDRNQDRTAIELVTAFQKGVKGSFYTANPYSKKVVRTKVNKDPRGAMPLDTFYGDIDGTNPMGRGIVELIGPLQNLIDSDMQAYQYNRALALQPPVVKYGNIGKFTFAPNEVVDASTDPNAKIVPLTIDTTALTNYPQLYGLQKSQLLNLVNSPDTSISADVGNPGFSKTPAGINQQKATLSVDDNTIRKHFETWFGNWSETAINLYFGERTGVDVLQLDKATADKLRKLAEEGKFDLSQLSEEDEVAIDYDTETPALKFRVDASTSKMADDQAQLAGLEMLNTALDSSPVLQSIVPPEKVLGLWNRLVSTSGLEDPEDLSVDLEQYKKDQAAAQEAQAQAQAAQPQMPAEQPMGQPGAEMQQPVQPQGEQPMDAQLDPDDQALIAQLQQLNVPEQVIQATIQDMNNGATAEEIIGAFNQSGILNGQR